MNKVLSKAVVGNLLNHGDELPVDIPTTAQRDKLERELEQYRNNIIEDNEHLNCGPDIASGFPESTQEQILNDCNSKLKSYKIVLDFPLVFYREVE